MTLSQIMAVLSLLLAFNVPQAQVNTVRSILMATQPAITQTVQIAPLPIKSSVTIQTMDEQLLPAYTLDQLMHLFHSQEEAWMGSPVGYANYRYMPVDTINVSSTTATVSVNAWATWDKKSNPKNGGTVVFQGKVISTPESTTGGTILDNLTPDTKYTCTYTYHEAGRQDSVFEFTFKTLQ